MIPSPYNTDEFLAKVDHTISDRQVISLSYFETSGHNSIPGGGNLPWSTQNFDWRQHNANASDTFTINADMVNQVWLSYTRNFGGRISTPAESLGEFRLVVHRSGNAFPAANRSDQLLHPGPVDFGSGGGHELLFDPRRA